MKNVTNKDISTLRKRRNLVQKTSMPIRTSLFDISKQKTLLYEEISLDAQCWHMLPCPVI
jgi:hypothetical protein